MFGGGAIVGGNSKPGGVGRRVSLTVAAWPLHSEHTTTDVIVSTVNTQQLKLLSTKYSFSTPFLSVDIILHVMFNQIILTGVSRDDYRTLLSFFHYL